MWFHSTMFLEHDSNSYWLALACLPANLLTWLYFPNWLTWIDICFFSLLFDFFWGFTTLLLVPHSLSRLSAPYYPLLSLKYRQFYAFVYLKNLTLSASYFLGSMPNDVHKKYKLIGFALLSVLQCDQVIVSFDWFKTWIIPHLQRQHLGL